MVNLEAVDAKVERAHDQLRLLRGEAADFCRERSRLIMPERWGERRLLVYRGGAAALPIRWSVQVGEFAHNLRSALDQLVWQLAAAHGECAGLHGDTPCPGRHNEFPIRSRRDPGRMDVQLCGVGSAAREYIASVQPPRRFRQLQLLNNGNRVGAGLGMLRDLCNQDKHQMLLLAHVRWTGEWPRDLERSSSHAAWLVDERFHPDHGSRGVVETVGHELHYGQALLITTGWSEWQWLEFPVDAYFDHLPYAQVGTGRAPAVTEVLEACMESVEMVVSRLREEL